MQPADPLANLDAAARAVRIAVETLTDAEELERVIAALFRRTAEAWPEDHPLAPARP